MISGNILYPKDESKPVTYDYFIQDDGLIKEFSISFKKSRGERLIEINDTNFPDAAFRNYLLSLDNDHDNRLDVNHIYEINVNDTRTIHDLKGIELFPYLTHIRVCGTHITQLDLSHNIFITEAICTQNYWMTHLDVEKCLHLRRLCCQDNDLEELDVTNNLFLEDLTCDGNQIKYLDVSNNYLSYLHCNQNQLTSLDISTNYGLQQSSVGSLECMDNKLIYYGTALDLSSLPGFQLEKASEWNNANITNGVLTPINALEDVSYSYNISKNRKCIFYISFCVEKENPSENDKPSHNENPSQNVDIPKGPDSWIGKTGTEGFVYRLYNVAMGRDADESGFNDWNTQLKSRRKSAAEVAQGFIFSEEFKNFHYNDVQYVKILYRTMFGREADEAGLNGWVSDLENGMSREYVYHGFAESTEFTNLCNNYGVERGTVTLSAYRDRNAGATGFIARLYTKMLGRAYDADGLEYWCQKYLTKERTIEDIACDGFLHSEELKNQNLSNEEFVTRMYQTFLNREPDEAGLKDWIGRLERGEETRDSLVYGFTNSQEFGQLKAEYNLP